MVVDPQTKQSVNALMEKAVAGKQVMAIAAKIVSLFMCCGLAFKLSNVNVDNISIHWLNRDGLPLQIPEMVKLLEDIFGVGFDPSYINILLIEVPKDASKWADAITSLIAASDGFLVPICIGAVQYLTLRGTHLCQALRCLKNGGKHTCEAMCMDGKLSLDKVRLSDTFMADAAQLGVPAVVLKNEVWEEFGADLILILQATMYKLDTRDELTAYTCIYSIMTIVSLILTIRVHVICVCELVYMCTRKCKQASDNVKLGNGENPVQISKRIYSVMNSFRGIAGGAGALMLKVKEKVLMSKPKCATSVPYMYSLVCKHSGNNAEILNSYASYACTMGGNISLTVDETFMKLITDDLKKSGAGKQASEVRMCLFAMHVIHRNVGIAEAKKMHANPSETHHTYITKCRHDQVMGCVCL